MVRLTTLCFFPILTQMSARAWLLLSAVVSVLVVIIMVGDGVDGQRA